MMSDRPSCTTCGQPVLDSEQSRRNLVGTAHQACPTAELVAAVHAWASAHPRQQPDRWRDVAAAVDALDETRHLVGLAAQTVATVLAQRTATSARTARADWRRRGETDRTHRSWSEARAALAFAAVAR